jgi:hypothetical protein
LSIGAVAERLTDSKQSVVVAQSRAPQRVSFTNLASFPYNAYVGKADIFPRVARTLFARRNEAGRAS